MPFAELLFFTALNLLNYLDRYLITAMLPVIRQDFGLSYEEAGRLVSAAVFGYFLTSPIFGYLGDRWNRPLLMTIGVVTWSLATFSSGIAAGFALFFLARIFVGVGEASFGTIAPGYLKDRIGEPLAINRAFALFYSAIPVGAALAYVVVGALLNYFTWHAAFFVGAIPGLILSVFLLKKPDVRVKTNNAPLPSTKAGIRQILQRPVLLLAIFGYVLNAFSLNGISAFVTQYGVQIGFQLEYVTFAFGIILAFTGLIGTLGGGALVEFLARKSTNRTRIMLLFVGIGALLGSPCVAMAFLVQTHWLFLGFCFLAQLVIFAGVAPINSVIVTECPPEFVTLTQGLSIFVMNLLGTLLAPWAVGAAADRIGLASAMQLATVALLLCGLVWCWGAIKSSKPKKIA